MIQRRGSNTGWYPIGTNSSNEFDGNFIYTISNLTASRTINYIGLFGYEEVGQSQSKTLILKM